MTEDRKRACVISQRRLLAAPVGPRPLCAEWRSVSDHLETCAECRRFLAEQQAWVRLGRRLAQCGEAPVAVRQRLFRVLALARAGQLEDTARPGHRRPAATLLLAIVALGVVVLTGVWGFERWGQDGVNDIASEDHWRELHRSVIESGDAAAVEQWLQARLAIPVQVVQIEDAVLEGARLCFLRSQRGAVILYRIDGSPVSYFVMPAEIDAVKPSSEEALRNEAAQGYNVITWQDQGLVYALVGALARERLLAVAHRCREQVTDADRGHERV